VPRVIERISKLLQRRASSSASIQHLPAHSKQASKWTA
jgi:hypothetical protein